LGAGNGTATLSFILQGCNVTAVDISIEQLNRFKQAFPEHSDKCNIVCDCVNEFLLKNENKFDNRI
jgi:2-polyprenyl-3-methyl-5-hydroxy-6-metoxy-1,4-benzoquinol methylase